MKPNGAPALLLITDGPIENAPARLRAYQYDRRWRQAGFAVDILDYGPYTSKPELTAVAERIRAADVVFIQRNLDGDVLRLTQEFSKPVIFDFDDALFYVRSSQILAAYHQRSVKDTLTRYYRRVFRGHELYSGKRRPLNRAIASARAVIAGNEYLASYSRKFNRNVTIVPTAVDVSAAPVKNHSGQDPVVIGWIGVSHNFIHLDHIGAVFAEIARRYGNRVVLKVVSSAPFQSTHLNVVNKQWKLDEENADVASFDIGIMPLIDDSFAEGKCSFKAILCMSHGVPVVVSDVGMNRSAVRHGETGFLAQSDNDWVERLSALIDNVDRRRAMGAMARDDMQRRYSVDAVFPDLLKVVHSVLPR
jgi:glycosyltransferase involved in cell wall biosynthesis